MLNWTPEGMIGALFKTMGPFAPRLRPARSRRLFGVARTTCASSSVTASRSRTLERDILEVTAFDHPRDYGEHFKDRYGPTIAAQANAQRNDQGAEFQEAVDRFCDDWNLGTAADARFEQEYLVVVGTRQ